MANNRLYIACDFCKRRMLVAKNCGDTSWHGWDPRRLVAEFIAEHLGDCGVAPTFYVEQEDGFSRGVLQLPDDYKAP